MAESKQKSKKYWRIVSKEGTKLEFFPIFEVSPDGDKQIEARYLEMRFEDEKGEYKTFTFDWLNMYMFMYYTSNEELRQNLAVKYERKVNMIPYDVTFKISDAEKQEGIARRRIELPIGELEMAIARDEAMRLLFMSKNHGGIPDPKQFMYKGRGGNKIII